MPIYRVNDAIDLSRFLGHKLLEPGEDPADLLRPTEIGDGVCNRVVVLDPQQRSQFFLIQLVHADAHIVRQNEFEKCLLPVVELGADAEPWKDP